MLFSHRVSLIIGKQKGNHNHHIELRLLLICFYIYIKQVTFHYSLLSSPFQHPYTYILWHQMVDLLLISIIFLIGLICLRVIFDFYGYRSLYSPFESFETKSITEKIIDFVFALIQTCFGLVLSTYMFIDIVNDNISRRAQRKSMHRLSILE
jgi:hypothetical protein